MPDLLQLAIEVGIRQATLPAMVTYAPSPKTHGEEAIAMADKKRFARPRVVRRKEKLATIVQFTSTPGYGAFDDAENTSRPKPGPAGRTNHAS